MVVEFSGIDNLYGRKSPPQALQIIQKGSSHNNVGRDRFCHCILNLKKVLHGFWTNITSKHPCKRISNKRVGSLESIGMSSGTGIEPGGPESCAWNRKRTGEWYKIRDYKFQMKLLCISRKTSIGFLSTLTEFLILSRCARTMTNFVTKSTWQISYDRRSCFLL